MYPLRTVSGIAAAVVVFAGIAACADDTIDPVDTPEATATAMSMNPNGPPVPGGLGMVSFGGNDLSVWPWTGNDFEGAIADPLTIFFTGDADILSLRAALRSLDGNRTAYGLPNAFPFNCTWTDASGETQTAWTDQGGWVANPVQLQCGEYGPLRFHIRFFPAGGWVVAGTHLDLQIPGTSDHRVISWELAEQLITVDFVRSGILDPVTGVTHVPFGVAGPAGDAIEAPLYAAVADLHPYLGVAMDGSGNYRAFSDGAATVLNVANPAPVVPDMTEAAFTIDFNQAFPRPFCQSGPTDYVFVTGPLDISTRFQVNEHGQMQSHNMIRATLDVTPIDAATGLPTGPTFRAHISETDDTGIENGAAHLNHSFVEQALPPGVGYLRTQIVTGPNGLARSTHTERCS